MICLLCVLGKIEIKEKVSYKQMVNGVWTWVKVEKADTTAAAAATEGAVPAAPVSTESEGNSEAAATAALPANTPCFERIPSWGDDLGSEHERYICERVYGRPTIVTDYPKQIKAFYMKVNPDNTTVAAMDILVPKIGELIGGSQREERLDVLTARCREMHLNPDDLWWYNDLRRYGTVPHAGFGLGFERLIMFVTGLENIRDVIPFPRVPGHAEF